MVTPTPKILKIMMGTCAAILLGIILASKEERKEWEFLNSKNPIKIEQIVNEYLSKIPEEELLNGYSNGKINVWKNQIVNIDPDTDYGIWVETISHKYGCIVSQGTKIQAIGFNPKSQQALVRALGINNGRNGCDIRDLFYVPIEQFSKDYSRQNHPYYNEYR